LQNSRDELTIEDDRLVYRARCDTFKERPSIIESLRKSHIGIKRTWRDPSGVLSLPGTLPI